MRTPMNPPPPKTKGHTYTHYFLDATPHSVIALCHEQGCEQWRGATNTRRQALRLLSDHNERVHTGMYNTAQKVLDHPYVKGSHAKK